MGAFPSALMPGYRILDERRENTVKGKWQNLDYKDFAECDRKEATMGPCSDPPLYQFGNTGFIMGEARDILRVLAGTTGYSNDQEGIIVYMMNHPEEVTLDYTGELVLALHTLKDSSKNFGKACLDDDACISYDFVVGSQADSCKF